MENGIVEVWGVLYTSGMRMCSGGAVAGLLAFTLEKTVSVYGAVPVVLILMLLFLFVGARMTPRSLIETIRARQPYDPDAYDDEEYIPAPVMKAAAKPQKRQTKRSADSVELLMLSQSEDFSGMIDIPLDGEVRKPGTKGGKTAAQKPVPQDVEYEIEVDNDSFFMYKKKPVAVKQTEMPAPETIEGKDIPKLDDPDTAESFTEMGLVRGAKPNPNSKKKPLIKLEEGPVTIDDDDDVLMPAVEPAPVVIPVEEPAPRVEKRGPQPSASGIATALQSDGIFEEPNKKLSKKEAAMGYHEFAAEIAKKEEEETPAYVFPPMNLLRSGARSAADNQSEANTNRRRLEATLASFGVDATYVSYTRGPTVTRYDFELRTGVKLTKLTNLSDDIALALGVGSVRIAPIPDKISTVGIEVPNKVINTVYLRDIIGSDNFKGAKSKVSFAIGEDIGGNSIVSNIAKLPHLLIAGTTGSGKSVCINCLLLSLLYKATPDEVKLIMIDPKMVELGVYNGIPHLYVPVVTDPKKAAGALQWSVVEMMKRYRLFSEAGVRDLAGYNNLCTRNGEKTMPQVVIVIDELADLMMVASKEVEESICRVAQMGRAAGMHLVIATQRPSADVITGLMKANIPSRIAFAVSSALESRIILDQQGAEKLIGMGDMLYAPIGVGKPVRIQGAFVSDEEREDVISFVKNHCEAEYDQSVQAQIEKAAEDKNNKSNDNGGKQEELHSEFDELLPQAVDVVLEAKQASVSMLQRRLKLGYSRAARIVDQMEEIGVVGPFEGSKPRQLLVTKEQWMEMQAIHGTAPMERMPDVPEVSDDELFDVPF
ncbi:MAG: DNA translocase FtsK [Oscillospiraceae bacterium]|nr:DNA translocase FtsK [Oscillospiraceae bacterium]